MSSKIQLKRGLSGNISSLTLSDGEPAFVTDTGKLYIGSSVDKVLINPINKPFGINTQNFYTKVKSNEYGQVVQQENLTDSDIPIIPNTKVSGLGTCSTINTGTSAGQIPKLDSSGKFPVSSIPQVNFSNNLFATYQGVLLTVLSNSVIPFNNGTPNGTAISLAADGGINLNEPGAYMINYSVTSDTIDATIGLGPMTTGFFQGSFSRNTANPAQPHCCCFGTYIRNITAAEKIALKNMGTINLAIIAGYASISVVKIS